MSILETATYYENQKELVLCFDDYSVLNVPCLSLNHAEHIVMFDYKTIDKVYILECDISNEECKR